MISTQIKTCDRCNSKITGQSHSRERPMQFHRYPSGNGYETDEARLCSICLDELWEFVFEEEVNRSDKADPIPLENMATSVERHIEGLEGVLEQLQEAKE